MDKKRFLEFMGEANKAGYAAGEATETKKEEDGSKTISYKSGDWRFDDNFFGGEPYGGREVVFCKDKLVWMMVYYGWVDPNVKNIDSVYAFLQRAISDFPKESPFRGMPEYEDGSYRYENSWDGDVERFRGEEVIYEDGKEIYRAWYMGGVVDVREG